MNTKSKNEKESVLWMKWVYLCAVRMVCVCLGLAGWGWAMVVGFWSGLVGWGSFGRVVWLVLGKGKAEIVVGKIVQIRLNASVRL